MKRLSLILGIIFLAASVAGCGSSRLNLNVASMPNVNPDNSGRPSPVLLKIYELRNDLAFKQADFHSVFELPVATLGADLIAADELMLVPGEARKIEYKPTMNTRYVGVLAGFRQMDRAKWRITKPLEEDESSILAIELNDATILVIPDKEAEDWEPEEAVKQFQKDVIAAEREPESSETGANTPHDAEGKEGKTQTVGENTSKKNSGDEGVTASDKDSATRGRAQSVSPVRQMSRNSQR